MLLQQTPQILIAALAQLPQKLQEWDILSHKYDYQGVWYGHVCGAQKLPGVNTTAKNLDMKEGSDGYMCL